MKWGLDDGGNCQHVDTGRGVIRDLPNDPALRKMPVEVVLSEMVEYGGPLPYQDGEDQQRSFLSQADR